MLPDQVSNPGPLTYESDALPIALRGPADFGQLRFCSKKCFCASMLQRSPVHYMYWSMWMYRHGGYVNYMYVTGTVCKLPFPEPLGHKQSLITRTPSALFEIH